MDNNNLLTKEQFYRLNSLYNESVGRTPIFSDTYLNAVREDSELVRELIEMGFVEENFYTITSKGVEALRPYKVEHAVIMAAGPSTRCIPLSLEIPKGLFRVKKERLIDREITQLQEAGISDITVVLGYKKEQFYYLKDKYNVRLIENDEFLTQNNIHSLYIARDYLENAYICSCDDYFAENPFNTFEYESFYAGLHVDRPVDEMFVYIDEDNRIVKLRKGLEKGLILLGHSFWNKEFADCFLKYARKDISARKYSKEFWEWMFKDYIDEFPPMFYKRYCSQSIVEFDYFDDLRRFDSEYIKHTNSRIIKNIISVFKCEESDIREFRYVEEGLTNTSFIFKINGVEYLYRHPGTGTDKIINRRNERTSLEIAKEWGIDPTFVDMNTEEGWKVSYFVPEFREPDYSDFEDSKKIIKALRKLHSLPVKVDYGLDPWGDAAHIESLLEEKTPGSFSPYLELKEKIGRIYGKTIGDGIRKCFCHGDTYKPNWMIRPDGSVILIDWEYSGFSDPGIDVGYYIVDAMYSGEEAERFIAEYLGNDITDNSRFHYLAYTALIAYYWFVWAMYRESCGAVMGDALTNWRDMAYRFADYCEKIL